MSNGRERPLQPAGEIPSRPVATHRPRVAQQMPGILAGSVSSTSSKRSSASFEDEEETETESPAKRQSKWTPQEDAKIIRLRGTNMKWDDISKHLPGRSPLSCRLHYQNYLERRPEWDEDSKDKLARIYERLKPDIWSKVAEEMGIPWRAAEAMHWRMGADEMALRAGVVPFQSNTDMSRHVGRRGSSLMGPPEQHSRQLSQTLPPLAELTREIDNRSMGVSPPSSMTFSPPTGFSPLTTYPPVVNYPQSGIHTRQSDIPSSTLPPPIPSRNSRHQ